MQPKFSNGEDEHQLQTELGALLQNGWKLNEEQRQLDKTYYFKTYTKVMDLHHSIGVGSKSKGHHAKMISEFGSLTVQWTTHSPPGLSKKDTFMARLCDERAELIGTVEPSAAQKCGSSSQV